MISEKLKKFIGTFLRAQHLINTGPVMVNAGTKHTEFQKKYLHTNFQEISTGNFDI